MSLFHVLCNQIPHLVEQWVHIFPNPPSVTYALTEIPLAFLTLLCSKFHVGFSFPNSSLESHLVFLRFSQVMAPHFHTLWMSFRFGQELLAH